MACLTRFAVRKKIHWGFCREEDEMLTLSVKARGEGRWGRGKEGRRESETEVERRGGGVG